MKAIVYQGYGAADVLKLAEVSKPIPKKNEILVKIRATTVTSGDCMARSLDMPRGYGLLGRLVFGVCRPRRATLGTEFAGIVEAVGENVKRFSVGDRVFAFPGATFGGYAEYGVIAEDKAVALTPAGLSDDEAAALSFGGATALNFLRDKAGIKRGDKVLIIGASGCVGAAAVQLASHFGAHVTGVCRAENTDLVTSFGAAAVIDYTTTDFAETGDTYDIILDTTGTVTYARGEKALKNNGRLLLVASDLYQMLRMIFTSKTDGKKGIIGYAPERLENLQFLAALAAAGTYKPYIDRRYRLDQIVDAHAYVAAGRKRGNVAVLVGQA